MVHGEASLHVLGCGSKGETFPQKIVLVTEQVDASNRDQFLGPGF